MNELVSIIMPSYNTDKYIKETVQSVLNQTYKNWELIIVDDCSTDSTDDVVSKIKDPRIKYLKNKKNMGAALSRNKALVEAKGRWIAFLDSDDIWMPEKLQKQIDFMKKNRYYFSYTNYEEIDAYGNRTGVMVSGPKKITRTGMYNYCWPGCLTVMFDVSKVGLIQIKDIKKNNDYAMWLKVCHKADCFLLDECLGQYRKGRTGSVSTHSIGTMVGWHYKLFHEAEAMGCISSLFNTGRNLVFGLYKKKKYVKRQDMNNNEAMIITLKDSTIYKIRRKIQILAFNIFGPDTMTKIYFKHLLGYSLNLKSPKTFNEKLCWYKLNYCPHNRLVIRCADKYYVRGYLKKKGYAKHLINILGVWDNPEQIEWSKLPKKFALKRTNGCGYNIICLDKEKLDEKYVKNLLKSWQKEKFGKYNVEPHYNRVKGKIICEEYIESGNRLPVDYKVHCFNGEPEFIMVCDGRNNKGTSFGYFDLTRKYLPYSKSAASFELDLEDAYLDEMISISKDIATDFPFVRVDFYISNSKLFIGELTFTPTAGYDYTITRAGDKAIGDLFNIEELMEKK